MTQTQPKYAQIHQVDPTTGVTTFSADVVFTGKITESAAASSIVPGATTFSIRNHADSLDNFILTDAGNATLRGSLTGTILTMVPAAGSPAGNSANVIGTTATSLIVPDNTTSIQQTYFKQNFAGATNGAVSNSGRLVLADAHWVDAANDVATMAAGYFDAYNDAVSDVQDLIGVIGRAFITGTGKSTVGMWGVRGDLNFTGAAAAVTSAAAIVAHQGSWSAAAVIATYSGIEVKAHNLSLGGAVVTNGFGANIAVPTNATGYNVGVNIGSTVAAGNYTVGLNVNTGGAWIRGNPTLPAHVDTSSSPCIIALLAGSNAGANDTNNIIYYYRSSAVLAYIGFDSDATTVIAGHTKALTDYVIAPTGTRKLLIDTNGTIWTAGGFNGGSGGGAIKGAATVPPADVTSSAATMVLAAGNNAAANTTLCALYYYRSTSVMGYIGFDSTTAAFQGHTKSVNDLVFATNSQTIRMLLDTGSNLWVGGTITAGGTIVNNHVPVAINSTAAATAAQVASGYITSTSAALTTITLPTGTALGTQLGAVQGTTFDLYIDNTAGANTVTIAVNTNAIQSALGGTLTVPAGVTGQACFRLMFSSATAYTFTRIA